MPNWVFSTLEVSGSETDISKFREEMSKPFTTYYSNSSYVDGKWVTEPDTQNNSPVFSFWNIVSPDPADYDEYFAVQPKKRSETPLDDPNWLKDLVANQAVSKHWYDWNNHHWGTKWDITHNVHTLDEELDSPDPTSVIYKFETAWSPVDELLVNVLSKRYPELSFEYEFEEEQGWGGNLRFQDGEISYSNSWDIPTSHADFENHEWRECQCQTDDDPEYWYSDCPIDETKYEWDKEESQWKEKESV